MFKDPLLKPEDNTQARRLIGQKMEQSVKSIGKPDQSDEQFIENILNLATLNLMADSHDGN